MVKSETGSAGPSLHHTQLFISIRSKSTSSYDLIQGVAYKLLPGLTSEFEMLSYTMEHGTWWEFLTFQDEYIQQQIELEKYTDKVNKVFYETFGLTNKAYPLMVFNTNKETDALNNQLKTVKQLKDEYAKLVETIAAGQPQKVASQAEGQFPSFSELGDKGFEIFPVDVNPFELLQNDAINFFDMYDERSAIMRDMTSDAFGNMAGAADTFFQIGGQKSKEMFALYKTFAIAQATISGYEAVMHSYKEGTKYGGPILGAVFAATAAAFSIAQIAKISSTSMNSSGGGGSAGGGGGSIPSYSGSGQTNNNSNNQNAVFNITITGGGFMNADEIARDLIPALKKAYGDTLGGV